MRSRDANSRQLYEDGHATSRRSTSDTSGSQLDRSSSKLSSRYQPSDADKVSRMRGIAVYIHTVTVT